MSPKIKRIIAREGLILVCIVICGLVTIFLGQLIHGYSIKGKEVLTTEELFSRNLIEKVGVYLLYLGYPIYLLIRFILWAVRTLRKDE